MQSEEPRPRYAHQLVYDEANRVSLKVLTKAKFNFPKSFFLKGVQHILTWHIFVDRKTLLSILQVLKDVEKLLLHSS